ncbi:hypothetical protein L7F22_017190 [Adiantum nelumboides]|nr:hypothetical protein [Adiantum nelumboides]
MGDQQEQQGIHLDANTMQNFQEFSFFMQQQQAADRRQVSTTKALHTLVNKVDQFDVKDVSKYLREYVKEMELHQVLEADIIANFELAVVPENREYVRGKRNNHGGNWEAFKVASKEEYFMKDSERVSKRMSLEWDSKTKRRASYYRVT